MLHSESSLLDHIKDTLQIPVELLNPLTGFGNIEHGTLSINELQLLCDPIKNHLMDAKKCEKVTLMDTNGALNIWGIGSSMYTVTVNPDLRDENKYHVILFKA